MGLRMPSPQVIANSPFESFVVRSPAVSPSRPRGHRGGAQQRLRPARHATAVRQRAAVLTVGVRRQALPVGFCLPRRCLTSAGGGVDQSFFRNCKKAVTNTNTGSQLYIGAPNWCCSRLDRELYGYVPPLNECRLTFDPGPESPRIRTRLLRARPGRGLSVPFRIRRAIG